MILHPMVEDGKEAVGSMGDDTPLAVLSRHLSRHAPLLPAELQPGHQPADRQLARAHVMTIRTRFGNLGNILDEDARAERDAVAASPDRAQRRVRGDAQVHGRHRGGASTAPSTLQRAGSTPCAQAFDRIRKEAEDAVRSGCLHIVLTDETSSADRAALPMILAAGCGALPSRAPGAAHLYLAQRALGRVPRHALFRRADRRRRDDGERLSRPGDDRRPPRARPVRQARRSASASPTTRRRSTRACSRSCRRWASR